MRPIWRALIISALALLSGRAWADAELVIAIRYLQAEGTSHSHLYLYREDGKLLRQLTNDNSGQDSAPIFSSDGETIVFTREKPNNVREFWSVKPRGADLKKLGAAPDWYAQAKSSPYFTNVEPQEAPAADATSSPAESASPTATPVPTYKSPDGLFELILREDPKDEDDQI
ncbi:MAG: TolB family protein, partial [Limisphaerales bacterium]